VKVFVWQRSDGWAWQTEKDKAPCGFGLLLKELATEEAEQVCRARQVKIDIVFTNPDGEPSLNA
jgi:hypothetical protein